MNKIFTVALIAGGLLLLDSPEAAAHKQVRNVYQPSAYYHVDHRWKQHRRAKHMPYWLKRDRAFRRWYKRTHLRTHRYIAWRRLYEIFLWESVYTSHRYRGDHYYRSYEYRDFDDRYDRDRRRRNRH